MKEIILVAGCLAATLYLHPKVKHLYEEAGLIRRSYRGIPVTPSLGTVITLVYIPVLAFLSLGEPADRPVILAGVAVLGMSFIGLLDDLNNENTRGLRGHLRSWLEGKLTAGFLKASWGGALSLFIAANIPGSFLQKGIGLLMIVLWANGINQLDRRPGRSLKSFLLLSLVLIVMIPAGEDTVSIMPLLLLMVIVFALLPVDLSGAAMLGDSGSNALGGFLGLYAHLVLPLNGQLIWLGSGLILNLVGEMFSLSDIIDRNRFLGFLDRLGREWGDPGVRSQE